MHHPFQHLFALLLRMFSFGSLTLYMFISIELLMARMLHIYSNHGNRLQEVHGTSTQTHTKGEGGLTNKQSE